MANIKNFGIVGIGAQVQFGKGGAQLIQTSGTFAAKDAGGTSFVRFQVADGASDNDAVTLSQLNTTVNAAVSNISSNLGSLSSEIDAIEAGAGLNSDGTYTAPTATTYLGNATSIANATELLDAALVAETAARVLAEGNLTSAIANTNSDVSGLGTELNLVETSVGLQPDGTLTLAAGNYLANAVDLVSAVETLDTVLGNTNSDVAAIDGRLTTAEGTLTQVQSDLSNTNANVATLAGEIGGFDSNISALQTSFSQVRADVDANSAILSNTVTDVANLRTDVDSNSALLQTTISNVATLQSDLSNEITDRTNADSALQTQIDSNSALLQSTVSNVAVLQSNVATLTSGLAQEITDRTNADSALQTQIDSNSALLTSTAADLSALTANAVLKDGSVAMTGTLQMNNNGISGLAVPVNPNDAATKDYVDTAIETLAGAFEYKGTVTPGPDSANATLLPVANAGAYYKALNTGFLIAPEANSVAFPINQNDGVVRNTNTDGSQEGGTWDVIAHVDSQVYGTPGEITVSGSTDTGFTVAIDGQYTADRMQDVSNEANARTLADQGLQTQIDSNAALLNSTISNVATLQSDVTGLRTDVDSNSALLQQTISNVATLQSDLSNEITDRTNADSALQTQIDSNAALLANTITSVSGLQTQIDSNAALLSNTISNVTVLQSDVAGLRTDVDSNSALLQTTIGDVSALRTDVDSNSALLQQTISNVTVLQGDVANSGTAISNIETGAGLNNDGTYTANATAHYISGATSLKDADDLLDAAVFTLQTSLDNLSQDKIVSLDGLTEVKAANTGVQFFGNVGGVMTQTGEILAGANTNTSFQADLTNADEIVLKATGLSSDVDLRLIAQGAGHVIIGETGVGYIQADNGYDMTVAGGIGGGNLNLLGTLVKVGGEDGTTIAQFGSVTNAVTYATVTNGTGDVTFGADSATASNIDLVFAPKGSGVVNVSSARVINVANAVAATDAVNLQTMSNAIAVSEVNTVRAISATVTESNATTTIDVITGMAMRVRVLVTGAFGTNATMTVGSAEGSANELVGVDDTDLTSAVVYVIETAKVYTAGTIQVTIAGADPSGTGSAQVLVEYIKS